jgi:cell wall assembly regulator SMI1
VAGRERPSQLVGIAVDLGDEMIGYWWHPEWVLFGRHVAATGMAIDQRPGPGKGAVGVFVCEGFTEFTMAASLGEYLAKVADSIENGTDFGQFRPVVKDGGLHWSVTMPSVRIG